VLVFFFLCLSVGRLLSADVILAVKAYQSVHVVRLWNARRVKFDKDAMSKTKLIMANLKSTGQSKFALEEKDEVY